MTSERKPTVLFLCTGNSARSQMAEAILRQRAGDRFEVHSAGLAPVPIHPLTVRVLEEAGYDLGGQRSRSVRGYFGSMLITHAISVCDAAAEEGPRLLPGALHLHPWPFPDPAAVEGGEAARLEAFRAARAAIEQRVDAWLREDGALATNAQMP